MVRKRGEFSLEVKQKMRGGEGEFRIEHILNQAELGKAGRLFAWGTLQPGHSIGQHVHEGEIEAICIVSGKGTVIEEGVEIPLEAGDVNYVPQGKSHQLINTGTEDLVLLACVLYPGDEGDA